MSGGLGLGLTRGGLGSSIVRVAWKMSQQIVGEQETGEFRQQEQATWYIRELIVRGIHLCKAAHTHTYVKYPQI